MRVLQPAGLLEELGEVEGGAVRLLVQRELRLVGRDRLRDPALLLVDEAEVVPGGLELRLLLEGLLQRPLGLVVLLLLDLALPELQEEAVLVHLLAQRLPDDRLRLRGLALAHLEVGELPEHLAVPGVELPRPLEADLGLVEPPLVLVGEGEAEERPLVLGVAGERLAVGGDRVVGPLGLLQEVAEEHVALDDLGVGGEGLLHLGDGVVQTSLRGRAPRLLDEVVEADLVLGIAARPLLEMPGADAAPQVAERGQPLLRLRVHRLRSLGGEGARRALEQARERLLEARDARGIRAREVLDLAGIGREVVELGPGRADVLEAPVLHGLEVAPAVVIAGIPALGVRDEPQPLAAREREEAHPLHGLRPRHARAARGRWA